MDLSGSFMWTLGLDERYGGGKDDMFCPLLVISGSRGSGKRSMASGYGVFGGSWIGTVSTICVSS